MSRPPSQRGVSVLPIVQALKKNPDAWNFVPPSLWRYLDDPIQVFDWYPERDYWVLLEALVKTLSPDIIGGDDPFRYFARFSVQLDIGGRRPKGGRTRSPATGVHSAFGVATDAPSFFRRVELLWKEYHDTGRIEIAGRRAERDVVVLRLREFVIPVEGFVRLQGYYLEEYARLIGLELAASVTRSTVSGHPYCEWDCALGKTPASEAYVASLSKVRP